MMLNEIVANKKEELKRLKADFPVKGLIQGLKMRIKQLPPTRDFIKAVKGKGIKIIAEVKKASPSKGVIRKDFDQIEIARIYEINGASAISVLTEERYFHGHIDHLKEIEEFLDTSHHLGMSCIVEVHDEDDIEKALSTKAKLIGINNRDLKTFKTDIKTTFNLVTKIPKDRVVISESGINSYNDVDILRRKGVHVFLVGESLMREKDVGKKLKELLGIG